MRAAVTAVLGVGLVAACAAGPRATGSSSPADADAAALRLYRGHCASCHRLRDPAEETRDRWAWALERYGPRAHLSEEERRLVLGYLQARARDAAPVPGGPAP
jgi:mono/diheme cytochrome c family protein